MGDKVLELCKKVIGGEVPCDNCGRISCLECPFEDMEIDCDINSTEVCEIAQKYIKKHGKTVNIIENIEEKTTNDELIEEDVKTSDNTQNKARNGIKIKTRKKIETLEVQGSNYNYKVTKTYDNINSLVEVIREDGVRYTSLEELQAIREKAIEEINKEFEEGKEILSL